MKTNTICVCGDPAAEHVDGMEECFIPWCGCKQFVEKADNFSDMSGATEGER